MSEHLAGSAEPEVVVVRRWTESRAKLDKAILSSRAEIIARLQYLVAEDAWEVLVPVSKLEAARTLLKVSRGP